MSSTIDTTAVQAFMMQYVADYQPYWILYAYALGVEPDNRAAIKNRCFYVWIMGKHERYRRETLHSKYASDYVQKFIEWLKVVATEERNQGKTDAKV